MRSWIPPLAGLLGFALAFGAAAFGVSLPGFDDHPGQLYRLQHELARGPAPWAWNPGWWTGYPELQFYPPGFFLAGLALAALSIGTLSAAAIYQALLWVTWIAPGVAAYALLLRVLGPAQGWMALPGAFVALVLSAGTASGVEGAVRVGMLPARLGLALLPLLALVLMAWLDGEVRTPWAVVPLVAAVVLLHPTHLPGAIALVGLATLLADDDRRARLARGAAVLAMAAAWTAFWTAPLVARIEHTRALAWGRFDPADLLRPATAVIAVLAALAWPLARRRDERLLAAWAIVMALVVGVDAVVAEPLGIRWLPSDRVADAAWLAAVLAAALTVARLAERIASRVPAPLVALGVAALACAASLDGRTLTIWPRAAAWPSLASVERGLRLDALWAALPETPDARLLFARSGAPLVYGTDWWRPHSHATALTPYRGGRPIVHGTFTHASPVAALIYRGDPGRGAIDTLAERLDGQALFGRPLDQLEPGAFNRLTGLLGVGAVVVLDEDVPRMRALVDNPEFARRAAIGPFVLWTRVARVGLPVELSPGHWHLAANGRPGDWVPAMVAYYPLWSAERAGQRLETRRGEAWNLEVRLGDGSGPIDLRYRAGTWEWAGVAVSAAGLAAWAIALLAARRRASR
jgi:hypothetical protein